VSDLNLGEVGERITLTTRDARGESR